MARVLVLVLAVLAPVFSFPSSTEYIPGTQIEQGTPLTGSITQVQSGVQEKTGAPVPTGCSAGYAVPTNQYQQNVPQPVTRVQDVPVNVDHAPVTHSQTPLFLPPQPVPVVPVSQAEQVIRPVVVPAEAIATGRVIIMAVEPIQQRAFPDVVLVPQQQQIVTETYTPIQGVEKVTPYQENYSPIQGNVEQYAQHNVQQNYNEVPQKQGQVPNAQQIYNEKQGYQVQNAQQVYTQYVPVQVQGVQEQVQKQAQTGVEYTPNTQTVEPVQGVQPVQRVQTVEQQLQENAQVDPQGQVHSPQQVPEYIQKQQTVGVNTQTQQRVYLPESNQPQQSEVEVQQQTYNVKPEQFVQSVESQQEVQQQVSEYVQHPATKTGNHVPQQVETYTSGQNYNFGDRIPQQQQHQVQDAVSQQQQYLNQPLVVENQQ